MLYISNWPDSSMMSHLHTQRSRRSIIVMPLARWLNWKIDTFLKAKMLHTSSGYLISCHTTPDIRDYIFSRLMVQLCFMNKYNIFNAPNWLISSSTNTGNEAMLTIKLEKKNGCIPIWILVFSLLHTLYCKVSPFPNFF